jgi:DedD protein
MAFLLVLGFMGGAVVGYGLGGTPPVTVPARVAATGVLGKASVAQPCTPTEADRMLRTADAAAFEPVPPPAPVAAGNRSATKHPVATATTATTATAESPAATTSSPGEPASAVAPETRTKYAVQLGVFGVAGNAERLASRVRARGYDPIITAMRNRSGQWLKRVNLSVYTDEDEATAAARTFRTREGLPAVVVALQEDRK